MSRIFAIRRRVLAGLGACALVVGAVPAEAVVRYDLVNQSYAFVVRPSNPAFTTPPSFGLALVVSDAAVARGTFSARVDGNARPSIVTGDAADFVSLAARDDIFQPQPSNSSAVSSPGFANIQLAFDAAGDVASSAIRYFGQLSGATLSGSGNTISGFYVTENGGCFGNAVCSVSGNLIREGRPIPPASPVPEPASMALLGFGLLGLAVSRRR